ncbi:MAG: hypothetical protein OXC03_03220 [Flavobacteriaceae bacterium]|nr:hypothetical protein [Flavobacteriaceae bacterium]
MSYRLSPLLIFLLVGCLERNKSDKVETVNENTDSITQERILIQHEINKISSDFYEESQLEEQWEDLIDLEESILDLLGLDPKAADQYLLDVDKHLEEMEESVFPEGFDTVAIRSRMALVRALAQKSIFYIRSYRPDSLEIALSQFFTSYNALMARIEATFSEINRVKEDSLNLKELDTENMDSIIIAPLTEPTIQ